MTSPHRCYTTCPVQRCRDCRNPERPPAPGQRGDAYVAAQVERLREIAHRIRARKAPQEIERP